MLQKKITVQIDDTDHLHLKMYCVRHGISIQKLVIESVMEKIRGFEDHYFKENPETKRLLSGYYDG